MTPASGPGRARLGTRSPPRPAAPARPSWGTPTYYHPFHTSSPGWPLCDWRFGKGHEAWLFRDPGENEAFRGWSRTDMRGRAPEPEPCPVTGSGVEAGGLAAQRGGGWGQQSLCLSALWVAIPGVLGGTGLSWVTGVSRPPWAWGTGREGVAAGKRAEQPAHPYTPTAPHPLRHFGVLCNQGV